jgi:NAD-dependent dihydropyrimidine dehydrogenase PreA subunit
VVLSRVPPEQAAEQGGRFAALCAALKQADMRFVVVDSIYDMPDEDPAAEFLRNIQGGVMLLGWHQARALKWSLARRGVEVAEGTKRVQCLDVRSATPEALVSQVTAMLAGAQSADAQLSAAGAETQPRWYPVIDYSLCTHCMECLNFCLFGVFGVDAQEKLRVVSPEQCRQDCPACARVCPTGAIIFPKYKGDPAIAGAEPAAAGRVRKLDLSGLFGKPKDRRQAALERDSALLKSGREPAGPDKVERLAREFEGLDL